jgi:tRNA(Ile)-lysidine synthetase-like protein
MDLVLPKPGSYVVAVSGGVDSMALLDMLRRQAGLKLVVAHFDHGIRQDSAEDRKLVQAFAKANGLKFIYEDGRLGANASEAKARDARYGFLRKVLKDTDSAAIITAHHQDDVLETAVINILRGSGRKGLTSLRNQADLLRPLLSVPKRELVAYAQDQGLKWREDSTNRDEAYLRNYVRRRLLTRFDDDGRSRLWQLITDLSVTNRKLDTLLVKQLQAQPVSGTLDRQWFNHLSHATAREVMAAWLRLHGSRGFDAKTLERLVVAAKVAAAGKTFPVQAGVNLRVNTDHLALTGPER